MSGPGRRRRTDRGDHRRPWPWLALLGVLLVVAACARSGPSDPGDRIELADIGEGRPGPPLLQAFDLPDLDVLEVREERWTFGGAEHPKLVTPHFAIHTTIPLERRTARWLPRFYESMLRHYTTGMVELPMPDEPLESYVFRSKHEWYEKTREILPGQSGDFRRLGRGGFTTRGIAVLYDLRGRDTYTIAAHEGWHQYTQTTFRAALPIWLEEGIATYMEGVSFPRNERDGRTVFKPERNWERRLELRDAVRDERLIPLAELLGRTPQSFLRSGKDRLLIYYAQVWALAHFLMAGEDGRYRPALEAVLTDAATGELPKRLQRSAHVDPRRGRGRLARVGPAIVLEYFNDDLDAFEQEYVRYVRLIVTREGAAALSRGREGAP